MNHNRSHRFRAGTLWFVGAVVFMALACKPSSKHDAGSQVQRGQYLVAIAGCDDCHSPKVFTDKGPQVDASRRLSGHPQGQALAPVPGDVIGPELWGAIGTNDLTAWAGPWGISFATNLTPHPDGLGLWTEEQFMNTLRTGKHLGVGRPVLPPMPWRTYAQMTDDDLRAMFAFLRTLPPIANTVPQPIPPEAPQ